MASPVRRPTRALGLPVAAVVALAALAPAPEVRADGRIDYLLHCGGCHLEDGSGNPPEVPDLGREFGRLAAFAEGRAYLARVPGAAQTPLSDAALAEVFNWVLATLYPEGTAPAFTGEEIAATRSVPLYDPLKARAELLASEREPATD